MLIFLPPPTDSLKRTRTRIIDLDSNGKKQKKLFMTTKEVKKYFFFKKGIVFVNKNAIKTENTGLAAPDFMDSNPIFRSES